MGYSNRAVYERNSQEQNILNDIYTVTDLIGEVSDHIEELTDIANKIYLLNPAYANESPEGLILRESRFKKELSEFEKTKEKIEKCIQVIDDACSKIEERIRYGRRLHAPNNPNTIYADSRYVTLVNDYTERARTWVKTYSETLPIMDACTNYDTAVSCFNEVIAALNEKSGLAISKAAAPHLAELADQVVHNNKENFTEK
ncbi:MAG: hypothetical protein LBC99_00125 [Spirochaetota bacterium]|jgi:chaperonin cofactor prefoldin|nr:hypothetical protein [Spirochaetota bacterium]